MQRGQARCRVRLVTRFDLLRALFEALHTPAAWSFRPAEVLGTGILVKTSMALAVRVPEGFVTIGVARGSAVNTTPGRGWQELQPWREGQRRNPEKLRAWALVEHDDRTRVALSQAIEIAASPLSREAVKVKSPAKKTRTERLEALLAEPSNRANFNKLVNLVDKWPKTKQPNAALARVESALASWSDDVRCADRHWLKRVENRQSLSRGAPRATPRDRHPRVPRHPRGSRAASARAQPVEEHPRAPHAAGAHQCVRPGLAKCAHVAGAQECPRDRHQGLHRREHALEGQRLGVGRPSPTHASPSRCICATARSTRKISRPSCAFLNRCARFAIYPSRSCPPSTCPCSSPRAHGPSFEASHCTRPCRAKKRCSPPQRSPNSRCSSSARITRSRGCSRASLAPTISRRCTRSSWRSIVLSATRARRCATPHIYAAFATSPCPRDSASITRQTTREHAHASSRRWPTGAGCRASSTSI